MRVRSFLSLAPACWFALSSLSADPALAAPAAARAKATTKATKATPKAAVRPQPRVVVTATSTAAPLRAALEEAINDEGVDGADVGVMVSRTKDGVVVAESGADILINPASNAKLITTAVALDALKPEFRFKTEYYVQGQLKDGTLTGNLVVKGFGDPTIVSERLQKVANELYLFGVEKITGSIVVDDSYFDGNQEARGWELEDAPDRAYAAPVSALAVNYNATAVYIRPAAEPGQPAIVRVDPPCEHVALEGVVWTDRRGTGVKVSSDKQMGADGIERTLLTVEGSVSQKDSPFRLYRRVYDPSRHFGSVLAAMLQQRGVKVRDKVVRGAVPDGARLIFVDKSERLTEVVSDLNHYSNNIIAETLIKAVAAEVVGAPGTFANGLMIAHQFLEQKVGFEPGTYIFQNGSGLNDVNRFTPRQLTRLLNYMAHDPEAGEEYVTSLAVAGTQGTIGSRMRDTPAERHLRAKTGTLRGVSALSGYVVAPGGDVLVFSVLTQNLKGGASKAWKVQNAIGAALASGGTYKPVDESEVVEGDAITSAERPLVEASPGGAP